MLVHRVNYFVFCPVSKLTETAENIPVHFVVVVLYMEKENHGFKPQTFTLTFNILD